MSTPQPISFSQLRATFGPSGTTTGPISLSRYYSNAPSALTAGVPGIPTTGNAISLSQFVGKSKPAATNTNVLLIYDTDNASTQSLVTYLSTTHTVTLAARAGWDGTNPSPAAFGAVIMLDGSTYLTDIPTPTQLALVAFVNAGGKYVHGELDSTAHDIYNHLQSMTDIILSTYSNGANAPGVSYTIEPGQASHPLFSGLTSPITTLSTTISVVVSARQFSTSPSTTLATGSYNGTTFPTVIARQLGAGKVVYLNNLANNYTALSLSDPHIQRLYLNALAW